MNNRDRELWMDRPEMERQVIGWLFIHPDALDAFRDAELTTAFSEHYPYRTIYQAMLATQPVEDVNLRSVVNTLRESGGLDAIGGAGVVAAAVDGVPHDFPFTAALEMLARSRRDIDPAV